MEGYSNLPFPHRHGLGISVFTTQLDPLQFVIVVCPHIQIEAII